jgi:purine-binding chemotaxis protein CheW
MATTRQFSTFYLDDLLFGVDLQSVQEVIRSLKMTRVPLAPTVVRGLINLRGQIVTGIDLRQRLGLCARQGETLPMNVVVRSAEGAVSLLVDEIADVVEVDQDSFEMPPETLRGSIRTMVLGVHKLDKKLLHVLDTDRACQIGGSAEAVASNRQSDRSAECQGTAASTKEAQCANDLS